MRLLPSRRLAGCHRGQAPARAAGVRLSRGTGSRCRSRSRWPTVGISGPSATARLRSSCRHATAPGRRAGAFRAKRASERGTGSRSHWTRRERLVRRLADARLVNEAVVFVSAGSAPGPRPSR